MIEAKNITKRYIDSDNTVIENFSYSFKNNGLYMLIGKSGCGKTTLLNILSLLDCYNNGNVYFNNVDLTSCNDASIDEYHNLHIGVVFQEYNLIHELSVYDNLRLVLELQEWEGRDEVSINSMIEEALIKVEMQHYKNRKVTELSGGEKQRVAIARVLVKSPNVIFADEPIVLPIFQKTEYLDDFFVSQKTNIAKEKI